MDDSPYGFDLTQLLNIIKPLPEIKILISGSENLSPLIEAFDDALRANEGVIDVLLLNEKAKVPSGNIRQLYRMNDFTGKVRAYEGLIYVVDSSENIDGELLSRFYHALENSGDFILLLNPQKQDQWALKEKLGDANFVAVNDISMNEKAMLLSARKMHGWGGGM